MMKKLVASGIALALFVSVAPAVHAETTTTTSATVQMEALMKQIKELQNQLAELTKKRGEIVGELKETAALAAELREGMTSEEVKALQEILAADPEIYPEGIVSGHFGPLTARAVAKFKAKHGIEGEMNVGEKTRARLNALANDKDFRCKAWGKMIAPGQMKKRVGNADIDLSMCAHVPGGIFKKLEGEWKKATTTATSTDVTAPSISNIEVDDIDDDSAKITFDTNERARATLWYSTDEDLDGAMKKALRTFVMEHEFELEDLADDTTYYFRIEAKDKAGNTATSSIKQFETEE